MSDARTRGGRSWTLAWIGLAVVLLVSGIPRVRMVAQSSPYVLHADEPITTRRAAKMVETGELNPRFFRYPSLPIYTTAAVFAVAHGLQGGELATGTRAFTPFYEQPEIGLSARYFVVAMSLAVMLFLGLAAARAFGSPVHLFLVPLLVASSARFLQLSWIYVNVDMFGAFCCAAAVLQVVLARGRDTLFQRALLPGLLCGLATGCKYYLGVVGLPALLVLMTDRPRFARRFAWITLCTVLGFLLSTPYALLDAGYFVEQVAFELNHYSKGHAGAEGEPGIAQVAYYLDAVRVDFGWLPSVVGVFGIGWGLARRRFETLLLLAFPLALILFLSTQRVNFLRNIVGVYAFFPVFISLGAAGIAELGGRLWARHGRSAGWTVAIVLLAQEAPRAKIEHAYSTPRDARIEVAEWIAQNVPSDRLVLLCNEVQIDPRALPDHRILQEPMLHFLKTKTIAGLARVRPRPVLVAPGVDRGSRLEEYYSKMIRRKLDRYEVLWRGGEREVPVKIGVVVSLGNPLVEVLDFSEE